MDTIYAGTDSCQRQSTFFIASLVNQTIPTAAPDVLHHQRVLVMQYIQCCGRNGLVYETTFFIAAAETTRHEFIQTPLCKAIRPYSHSAKGHTAVKFHNLSIAVCMAQSVGFFLSR